ncbi:MAG TPA: N-acetylmuramoyl-L-alanine amidase [Chitinophagaceae bacterium]
MIRIVLPCLLIISFFSANWCAAQEAPKKTIKTIVIDPGHGGLDPGASGTFSTEAQVSLAVSLKLGKAIEKEFPHIKQVFTRTTDVLPGNKPNKDAALRYRADLANSSGGDLFIAVHCNSAGRKAGGWYAQRVSHYVTATKKVKVKKKWVTKKYKKPVYETYWVENLVKGTETYIWAVNKNDAKVNSMSQTNSNEYYGEIDTTSNIELPDPKDPAEKARMLIYTLNYFRKSLNLATLIEKQFVDSGRVSRGVKQRNDKGIWVLQATGMPSILVEIGFISNKEEEAYINSEEGQNTIVANIVNALKTYISHAEGKIKEPAKAEQKAF